MALLTKGQLLERRELPVEEVEVPEWQGSVRVRGLTGGEADAFMTSLLKRDGRSQFMDREHYCARLVARCLVDANGERLLTDAEAYVLSEQSAIPIQRLAAVAERLSGLQVGQVESAAKN